ncbi:MAG TPA: M1 family metallopeptidase [Longimicrobiales bacterium]|nr:M1 family metallopeptidase [Longimicrobiales bacterium]
MTRVSAMVRRVPEGLLAAVARGVALVFLLVPAAAQAQTARPVPGPVVPPPHFRAAVEAGTRSVDGRPGPAYWQNRAQYRLDASLDPADGRVAGTVLIRYENRSPRALEELVLHLHQNLHAPGVMRNEPQEVTGGVELREVRVDGGAIRPLDPDGPPRAGYRVEGTLMHIGLDRPVPPNGVVEVEVGWSQLLPQNGAGRMGHSRREMYFVAYWFPKMAVYDDLRGWDAEPYLGGAEFYDAFADYEASLTVPGGWTVMATGDLLNAPEVFTAGTLQRLAAAAAADTVVTVARVNELAAGTVTVPGEALTYRFRATGVRDFTWTASNAQQWDATSARVPDRDGDGAPDRVAIHAFWRPERAPLWRDQARYGKHAIEFHSRYTGLTYPWPHMTSVEGGDIIGGGMEFPMLTLIGDYRGRTPQDLYNVTSHELAHMWIPMVVGTNEKRYAWMDEGSTTFLENESRYEYWPGTDAHALEREVYLAAARAEAEEPLMRHGDHYQAGGYGVASYSKPGTLLGTLRGLLGEETFLRAYRAFIRDWAFQHPTPWDLFNTFEREAALELDWFWQAFFYETWVLDQAVAGVETGPAGSVIRIQDRGFAPMPATVHVETASGSLLEREIPLERWLAGETVVEIRIPAAAGPVVRVEIDPRGVYPDVDRGNNVWRAPPP